MLRVNGHYYRKNTTYKNSIVWRCFLYESIRCRARAKTIVTNPGFAQIIHKNPHIHALEDYDIYGGNMIQLFNQTLDLPYFAKIEMDYKFNDYFK
jgi:hypothetical protein